MNSIAKNWLDSTSWQAEFYQRAGRRKRNDAEFEWKGFDRSPSGRFFAARRVIKTWLHKAGLRSSPMVSVEWLHTNSDLLWETRSMLADDLSKLLFDSALVLRMTSHRNVYFPRIDFDDLISILGRQAFDVDGLPKDYLGTPIEVFDLRLNRWPHAPALKMIGTEIQIRLINSYRQYLVNRNGIEIAPKAGDVVLDCGACIGDFSLLFAGMVGAQGQVHSFDPVPLHSRYGHLQASLNPSLAPAFHINILAVGDSTYTAEGNHSDSSKIDPGQIKLDAFSCTTLDDYATSSLRCVDFIKMDIEGAELAALNGGSGIISEFKPTLAISGYHKPEDLWEIPQKIRSLNPAYEITFGHHSPVHWESVFYAVQRK